MTPEGPGTEDGKEPCELLVEALVEESSMSATKFCVTLQKRGIDSDWWAIYEGNKKDYKEIADQINKAMKRFGLVK